MASDMFEVGGYACNFVAEEPPKLFKCEICRFVLRDPQLTECCGKNACRSCIAKVVEENGACPIPGCAEPCVKINFNRDLRFEILQSVVYCTLKDVGCQWIDKLENLDNHLEECLYAEEECKNSCGLSIQRRQVRDHESICERFPVKCHQCGKMNERRNQSCHLKVCPLSKTKCPFNIVGCMSEMLNKDLQHHFNESLSNHYALVAKSSEAVRAEIKESKILAHVQNKFDPQIAEVTALKDEVAAAELEVAELKKALEEAESEFEELEKKHNRIAVEMADLSTERDAALCSLSVYQSTLVLEAKVRCYGPALPALRPSDITSRPLRVTKEYTPRVTFFIRSFSQERKNDAHVCLPPFFSHHRGYKMCLVVYCNGYMEARGECLSIFVSVLKGAYDDYLDWPMKCQVAVEVVSAEKGTKNISHTIMVQAKSRTLYYGIPQSGTICGSACVMNLNLLTQQSKYLRNGSLNIEVVHCS